MNKNKEKKCVLRIILSCTFECLLTKSRNKSKLSALNSTIFVLIRFYHLGKLDFIWFCFTISYVLCQVIMIKIFWSRFLDLCWVHAHKLVKRISPKCIPEILENLEVWNGMQINSFKNGISNLPEVLSSYPDGIIQKK